MFVKFSDSGRWTYEFIDSGPFGKMFIESPHSGKTYRVERIEMSEDGNDPFEFTFKDDILFKYTEELKNAARVAVSNPELATVEANLAIHNMLTELGYKEISDLHLEVFTMYAVASMGGDNK